MQEDTDIYMYQRLPKITACHDWLMPHLLVNHIDQVLPCCHWHTVKPGCIHRQLDYDYGF